jgi:hypothetical protein
MKTLGLCHNPSRYSPKLLRSTFWGRTRASRLFISIASVLGLLSATPSLWACRCDNLLEGFNAAMNRGDFGRANQLRNQLADKCPDFPLPPPPPPGGGGGGGGLPAGGGGVGRGGAVGGAGYPGGPPIPFNAWIRNFRTNLCAVAWNIVPVNGNPAGFTVTPTSGTNVALSFTNLPTLAPFTVTIDSNTPPGAVASFNITFIDLTNGLPYGAGFQTFQVQATTNVDVEPLTVALPVKNAPVTAAWKITNPTAASVTKTYSFEQMGDPASQETLNDGTPYFIQNSLPADKVISGGSVTIPANSSVTVSTTYNPTMYCDPEMCGNYALVIDGGVSTVCAPNDSTDTHKPAMPVRELLGTAQGGTVSAMINSSGQMYTVEVPTFSGDSISGVIDRLGTAMLVQLQTNAAFNFQPMVTQTTFSMMVPADAAAGFTSTDPGLTWAPYSPPATIPPFIGNGTIQRLPNGTVQFTVGTFGNNFYLIQSTTDFGGTNSWTTIGSILSTTNSRAYPFIDTQATSPDAKFYRVLLGQ